MLSTSTWNSGPPPGFPLGLPTSWHSVEARRQSRWCCHLPGSGSMKTFREHTEVQFGRSGEDKVDPSLGMISKGKQHIWYLGWLTRRIMTFQPLIVLPLQKEENDAVSNVLACASSSALSAILAGDGFLCRVLQRTARHWWSWAIPETQGRWNLTFESVASGLRRPYSWWKWWRTYACQLLSL